MGPWHDWLMVTFAEDGEDDTVENVMEQNNDRYFKEVEYPSKYYVFCCQQETGYLCNCSIMYH